MHWLLAALLTAGSPTAADAVRFGARRSWDKLYLAFALADPAGYDDLSRLTIGSVLTHGCQARLSRHKVKAYAFGKRASVFAPENPDALLCLLKAAIATQEYGVAQQTLERIPQELPQHALGAMALASAQGNKPKHALETQSGLDHEDGSLTYSSGEGPHGMRTRGNSRFVMKYFNNGRDFGQRTEYEGRIADALDKAYAFAQETLGVTRAAPCDVVLYTRDEFAANFSAAEAQRVAGLYAMNAIRINDAVEIDTRNQGVLVHEYVHAVLDDLVGGQALRLPLWLNEGLAEYVEWRFLGSDDPPFSTRVQMKSAARGHRLPTLKSMDRGAPINAGNPAVAYGVSALAVRRMLKNGGMDNLLGYVREVGAGEDPEGCLQKRYDTSMAKLQEEVSSEL